MEESAEGKLETAVEVAKNSGKILIDNLEKGRKIEEKTNRTDLVTEMDKRVQEFIVDRLNDEYPEIGIIAEEDHFEEKEANWIIDPIDGTTNYAIGYPIFCVSIGLEESGTIKSGVVNIPVLDETFTARRNAGAWLNGNPISVSAKEDFSRSVWSTGFPYESERVSRALKYFVEMMEKTRGVRRDGAAALDLCYVAAGRFDGFWELGLKPWDVAAGSLIVEEAGGKVTTLENEKLDHRSFRNIVASNGFLHEDLIETLGSIQRSS